MTAAIAAELFIFAEAERYDSPVAHQNDGSLILKEKGEKTFESSIEIF